jgi:hypothetical protein
MKTDSTENRIIWVVGALERLARLGYFSEVGYTVGEEMIDFYYDLDETREYLFDSDLEIMSILIALMEESNPSSVMIQEIFNLVVCYKNDRNHVFSYAMKELVGVK